MSDSFAIEPEEAAVEVGQAKEAARVSLDFFGALAMPDVFIYNFAPIFVSLWNMLTESILTAKDFARYAIGLPRGHGKSTVIKLLVLWAIFFSKKRFILIVGASQELAENILSDVWDLLQSDNIVQVFGDTVEYNEKAAANLKKIAYGGRPIILAAMGFNSAVRGLNLKNERPDFMIFDDAQTRENALSPTLSKEFASRFYGTFMKLKSPHGCTYTYIGNMYRNVERIDSTQEHKLFGCLMRNLQNDPNWTTYITGAILSDGKALWEELHPLKVLLDELAVDKAAGEEEAWYAEVQNDPDAHTRARLDFSKIIPLDYTEETLPEGACVIIDPATSKSRQKKTTKDNQVVTHVDMLSGKPVIRNVMIQDVSSKKLIQNVLEYCLLHSIPLILVEDVAYQYELIFWFNETVNQLQIQGITIEAVSPKGIAKNARIRDFFKAMFADEIKIHKDAYSQVAHQAAIFDPLSEDNLDDILDTCAYIPQAVSLYLPLWAKPHVFAEIYGVDPVDDPSYNTNFLECTNGY